MRTAGMAAVAFFACAHAWARDPFVCPAHGGPAWAELTTEHFVLDTALAPRDAERLARELEGLRGWVVGALLPDRAAPDLPERVRVVAFRTAAEYAVFAPPGLDAIFARNGIGEPVVIMPGGSGRAARLVVAHELAHFVLLHVYPRQPRWFGEGLAGLAEAAADGTRFGALPPHRRSGFVARSARVRDLLAWGGEAADGRFHDTATVLVHYLQNREPERLAAFRARLERAEAPDAAWRAVFPEWAPESRGGPEQLDAILAAHVRRGGGRVRDVPLAASAAPGVRALSPPEVHAIRLSLPQDAPGDARRAAEERAEIEEALREDPDHVVALGAKAEAERLDALPLARRAARAHPDDVRAWLWVASAARAAGSEDERLAALERAISVAPRCSVAANNLAWALLGRGRVREALPLAERAARLAPGDAAVLDTLAAALEASGRCVEALDVAQRALELVPAGVTSAPWRTREARLRSECTPARAAASPGRP